MSQSTKITGEVFHLLPGLLMLYSRESRLIIGIGLEVGKAVLVSLYSVVKLVSYFMQTMDYLVSHVPCLCAQAFKPLPASLSFLFQLSTKFPPCFGRCF